MKLKLNFIKLSKTEITSFVLTLIATLIGVLLAISLSNSEAAKKEKEDTVKLLNSANIIVKGTSNYTRELDSYITNLKDTVHVDSTAIRRIEKQNPIPYPDLLESIIANDIVSKNLSQYTHTEIYIYLLNLRKLAAYKSINYYQKSLEELELLLELESKFQEDEINLNQLKKEFAKGRNELAKKYRDKNVTELNN
ncbi:hypothetical protein [Prolixibacter denitrificans]|uniref:Uncharacterized protein n=1 Tax=Prolixibacter denitrificans TaxID=1541063 RepID=A0A2P8C8H4_9BACT|nr:hypothetical protein [Prolixibacter denitrificans]PSK81261.1 hypothetical protein CLV93_11045 [Prolixibacter denitrificans]GET21655.1 hypothetical protein JCM18694_19010 [Prolixibacter denitrificans]